MSLLPDIESVRCFVVAAETLNFRAASSVVALSPAAFGDRIARLEDAFGARLFERTTRSVALTAAGLRVLPRARRLVAEARQLASDAAEDRLPEIELTIGTRFELGMSWLVPSIPALEAARPGRTVHVAFGDSPDLMRNLDIGRVDAVVTSLRLTAPRIAYVTLHEERYVFVGAPELLAAHPLSGPADAADHTLIDTLADLPLFRYFLDAGRWRAAWSFGKTRYMGAIGAVRELVRLQLGVAVLPRYFVQGDLDSGALVPILTDIEPGSDHFRLIWRADHPLQAELHHLGEALSAIPLQ